MERDEAEESNKREREREREFVSSNDLEERMKEDAK
jgi:hypothetical protein